jgi:hypothetical protein
MKPSRLPGADLIEEGVADLLAGVVSIGALLVSQAPDALRAVGISVEGPIDDPEMMLYRTLEREFGNGAHSKYNAYRRQLASFLRAARCVDR